jgi:hypothetical protein
MDVIRQNDPLRLHAEERASWTAAHVAMLLAAGAGLVLFVAVLSMLLVAGL